MNAVTTEVGKLTPLPYHLELADYLKRHEPEVWRWEESRDRPQDLSTERREALRLELLRDSYRIPLDAHPEIHACLQQAMDKLGLLVPATLYQSSALESNASLVFVPGEIHIILHGRLLEQMSGDELTSIFGHELAHYLLWSSDQGKYYVLERILRGALESDYHNPALRETYRRYLLHTELYADRGSAVAVGAVEPVIAALVKFQTGSSQVDAKAYLQQAEEIAAAAKQKTEAYSHPEVYIRARALLHWWENDPEIDAWITEQLQGRYELEALDFLQQEKLSAMLRSFLTEFLRGTDFVNDAVTAQMRFLFPDWKPNESSKSTEPADLSLLDRSVKRVLNALMMDLCLADPEQQDAMLVHAVKRASALESMEDLAVNLRRDAGLNKREIDKLIKLASNNKKAQSAKPAVEAEVEQGGAK